MYRWLTAALFVSLVCGCGGSPSTGDQDAAPSVDAGPSCGTTWRLVEVPATAIALIDPAPVNTARSVRFLVTSTMGGCLEPAPPRLSYTFEDESLTVQPMAWETLGTAFCTDEILWVERPVTVVLERPGLWTVRAGEQSVQVDVGIAPSRPCMSGGGACAMDCDCRPGERCLGGNGFGGPYTECAVPCETDRDCDGRGRCLSVADGLGFACVPGDECDSERACPVGFSCESGACEAGYTLGAQTRRACDCDDDCDPGLRCVEPAVTGGDKRCEATCPTQTDAVCTGAHRCGPAAQDVAGTAASDAVCIWDGE